MEFEYFSHMDCLSFLIFVKLFMTDTQSVAQGNLLSGGCLLPFQRDDDEKFLVSRGEKNS